MIPLLAFNIYDDSIWRHYHICVLTEQFGTASRSCRRLGVKTEEPAGCQRTRCRQLAEKQTRSKDHGDRFGWNWATVTLRENFPLSPIQRRISVGVAAAGVPQTRRKLLDPDRGAGSGSELFCVCFPQRFFTFTALGALWSSEAHRTCWWGCLLDPLRFIFSVTHRLNVPIRVAASWYSPRF